MASWSIALRIGLGSSMAWIAGCQPQTGRAVFDGTGLDGTGLDGLGSTSDAGESSGSSSEDGSGTLDPTSDDADEPFEPYTARGIEWTTIEANQGVEVELGRDGVTVEADAETPQLLWGRPAMIRASFATADGWTPRPIRAELTLTDGAGNPTAFERTMMVAQSSVRDDPSTSFTFFVPSVASGTRYSLTLYEVEWGHEHEPESSGARFPATDGAAALPIEPLEMRLRVHLVPFRHVDDACDRTPPIDARRIERFRAALEAVFPIQSATVTVAEPIEWDDSMTNPDEILEHLVEVRSDDGPAPNVYYMGVIWPCDEGTGDGGRAFRLMNPVAVSDAPFRVGYVVHVPDDENFTDNALVHELGHNHGRFHVACSGTEGTYDENYPHPGGLISRWGFGIHDEVWIPPSHADMMSYCTPSWTSDYGWNLHFGVIAAVTQQSSPSAVPLRRFVMSFVADDGERRWTTMELPDHPIVPEPGHSIEIYDGTTRIDGIGAAVHRTGHGAAYVVVAPLPPDRSFTRIVHVGPSLRAAVDRDDLQRR